MDLIVVDSIIGDFEIVIVSAEVLKTVDLAYFEL